MQYPLAHIGNDQTTLLDAYPINPAEMRAAKDSRGNNCSTRAPKRKAATRSLPCG